LGAMGNHRELIAMQAAGLPIARIIKAVMFAGAVLVIAAALIGEFVAPLTEREAQLLKVTAQSEQVVLNARYGLWLREGGKFINIRQIQKNGDLADLNIYELDDQRHLSRSTHAEQAVFLGKQQWKLEKIRLSEISTQQVTSSQLEEQVLNSSLAPDLLKIVVVNPDNLSLVDLQQYIEFLKKNNQKSQVFQLAFWGRVVNPLITFVMLLLSAPIVIGIRRGVSTGARMMIGIVIGMGFNIIDRIVGHIGLIYDYNPALVAMTPSLTVLVLAVIFTRRLKEQ